MAARVAVAVCALSLAGGCSPETGAKARGKQVYRYCSQCHLPDGGGSKLAQAPAIAGLDDWYVTSQLEKFKTGIRGAHPDDAAGLRMRPMTRTLSSTEDIQVVAAYIASLPPVKRAPTLGGDRKRGSARYQACAACHGAKGEGSEALGAPRLAGRDDWYVMGQLAKFRNGVRGADPRDAGGAQMAAMARTLPDEQAIRDVAAYISALE